MRILLCLLSDQHVPNLISVHHFRPDQLILVETQKMKSDGTAKRLLAALAEGGLNYGLGENAHVETLNHEDSLHDVSQTVKAAFRRFPSDDWIVNVTGGTKPMSIGTFQFFHNLDAELVYVNNARPETILWLDGSREQTCSYLPRIKEWLLGYGFRVNKTDTKLDQAQARAQRTWECARLLAESASPSDLVLWNDDERRRARNKGIELLPSHQSELMLRADIRRSLSLTFGLQDDGDRLSGGLDEYGARFLAGEWLDVFFWGLLTRLSGSIAVSDVRIGLEVVGQDGANNEFDVTFMHRHQLCMIECKSGAQEHDLGTEILYKIEAVMRQFRAIRIRKILATTSPSVFQPGTEQIRPPLAARSQLYECTIVTHPMIRQLALSVDAPMRVAEILGLRSSTA